jgi:hypothetical protein
MPEGRKRLGRSKRRWKKDNIDKDLKATGHTIVCVIETDQMRLLLVWQ